MISPILATILVCSLIVVYGVILPILNAKFKDHISYRWSVVVLLLGLMLGAVIDFETLSDDVRRAVLIGGLIVSGGFVLLRTIEKCLARGWLHGARLDVRKGDARASLSVSGEHEAVHPERKNILHK